MEFIFTFVNFKFIKSYQTHGILSNKDEFVGRKLLPVTNLILDWCVAESQWYVPLLAHTLNL